MDPGERREPVRVLIADDDPRVRAALRTFLSSFPEFDVVADAGCAPSAVRLAREHAPMVALVDILLPAARDGLGLLRTLNGELRIPTVAISMHGEHRDSALAAGARQFLSKDGSPEQLLAALHAAGRPGR